MKLSTLEKSALARIIFRFMRHGEIVLDSKQIVKFKRENGESSIKLEGSLSNKDREKIMEML